MRRYALRDDQWDRIKDILPGREGHVGGTTADNRQVSIVTNSGVLQRAILPRGGGWERTRYDPGTSPENGEGLDVLDLPARALEQVAQPAGLARRRVRPCASWRRARRGAPGSLRPAPAPRSARAA